MGAEHAERADRQPSRGVQARAEHSQSTITDRYIHAAQVLFPRRGRDGGSQMFGVAG